MCDYCYFLIGSNIIRAPKEDYSNGILNVDRVEVLVWKNSKDYLFEKNDVSFSISENNNVFASKAYDSELEILKELGIIKKEETKTMDESMFKYLVDETNRIIYGNRSFEQTMALYLSEKYKDLSVARAKIYLDKIQELNQKNYVKAPKKGKRELVRIGKK